MDSLVKISAVIPYLVGMFLVGIFASRRIKDLKIN